MNRRGFIHALGTAVVAATLGLRAPVFEPVYRIDVIRISAVLNKQYPVRIYGEETA